MTLVSTEDALGIGAVKISVCFSLSLEDESGDSRTDIRRDGNDFTLRLSGVLILDSFSLSLLVIRSFSSKGVDDVGVVSLVATKGLILFLSCSAAFLAACRCGTYATSIFGLITSLDEAVDAFGPAFGPHEDSAALVLEDGCGDCFSTDTVDTFVALCCSIEDACDDSDDDDEDFFESTSTIGVGCVRSFTRLELEVDADTDVED